MALSRLLRRARDSGQACVAVPRLRALPASLRCRYMGDGYELELHRPEDVQVDHHALREMFAFTSSEAVVAAKLCDGYSPADLAARLGVQLNTVQAHIKRALAKTGCRRQVELVALLLRSAARGHGCPVSEAATVLPTRCAARRPSPAEPDSPGGGA
jgi:DNA-binding CsgD family transcriptional regulator